MKQFLEDQGFFDDPNPDIIYYAERYYQSDINFNNADRTSGQRVYTLQEIIDKLSEYRVLYEGSVSGIVAVTNPWKQEFIKVTTDWHKEIYSLITYNTYFKKTIITSTEVDLLILTKGGLKK